MRPFACPVRLPALLAEDGLRQLLELFDHTLFQVTW